MNITELLETRYLSGKKATPAVVRSKISFVAWHHLTEEFPTYQTIINAYIQKLYTDKCGQYAGSVLKKMAGLKKENNIVEEMKAMLYFFPHIFHVNVGGLLWEHLKPCELYFKSLPFEERVHQMHESGYLKNVNASFKQVYRTWSVQDTSFITLSHLDETAFRRRPYVAEYYQEYNKRKEEPGYQQNDWIYYLLRCFHQGYRHSALEVASVIGYSFLDEPIIPKIMYGSECHRLWWVLLHVTNPSEHLRIKSSWLQTVSDSINVDILAKMPAFRMYQQRNLILDDEASQQLTHDTKVSDIWHDWNVFEQQFNEDIHFEEALYLNH